MPPKFKLGDLVLHNSQSHAFCAHKPGAGCSGSIHAVAAVLPFTLHTGQVVNVKDLGRCEVSRVVGSSVSLTPEGADMHNSDYWRDVIDVDQPDGTPVPSYELKGQTHGEKGNTFWASENSVYAR